MYHIFFINSFNSGHLGYFHVLALVNSTSMNTVVCMFHFKLWFSLDIRPGMRLQDYMVSLFLVFKEPSHCSPRWLNQFTFSPTVKEDYLFPQPLQHSLFKIF